MDLETLDVFTEAYIECMLFTDDTSLRSDGSDWRDYPLTVRDINQESLSKIREACRDFVTANEHLLLGAIALRTGYAWPQAGHDFWLTRNRHGAGYWDRGLGEVGAKLTDAAHACGEMYVYRGGDGKIYVQ